MKIQLVLLSNLLLSCLFNLQSIGQTIIWSEDFPYADGTESSSKWSCDVSGCQLDEGQDYFEVRSNHMEGRDLDGEAVWISEAIDVSGYKDILLSVDMSHNGNLETSDYIRVYYNLDGSGETFFETNGNMVDDFSTATATQSGLNGNQVVIVICVKNNANTEYHQFDNIIVEGTAVPEFDLKKGNDDIPDGGVYDFGRCPLGSSNDVVFTIENTGTGNLTLDNLPLNPAGPDPNQFSIIQQPNTPIPPGGDTQIRVRFLPTKPGNKIAHLTIQNSDADEDPYDVILNGAGENTPPVISDILNQTTDEDTPTAAIPFTVNDAEQSVYSLAVYGRSQDPSLVPDECIIIDGNGQYRTVTITAAPNAYGNTLITLYASDGIDYDEEMFRLIVTPVNDPPCFLSDLPPIELHQGERHAFLKETLYKWVEDIDNADSTLIWSIEGNSHIIGGVTDDSVWCQACTDWTGTDTLEIIVSDGELSNSALMPVTIITLAGKWDAENTPQTYSLFQNHPNPFNPTTTIRFGLPKSSHVSLTIYNNRGQAIQTLVDEIRIAGIHTIQWNASQAPSGIYVFQIRADGFNKVIKCMKVK